MKRKLSFQRDPKPIPALAGPLYRPFRERSDTPDLAMQEAVRRSERQPRLISISSKPPKGEKCAK